MTKTASPTKPVTVKLSETAVQLINEIWDQWSLLTNRTISPEELKKETLMHGDMTMGEYEYHLRQKLLKIRNARNAEKPEKPTSTEDDL